MRRTEKKYGQRGCSFGKDRSCIQEESPSRWGAEGGEVRGTPGAPACLDPPHTQPGLPLLMVKEQHHLWTERREKIPGCRELAKGPPAGSPKCQMPLWGRWTPRPSIDALSWLLLTPCIRETPEAVNLDSLPLQPATNSLTCF